MGGPIANALDQTADPAAILSPPGKNSSAMLSQWQVLFFEDKL